MITHLYFLDDSGRNVGFNGKRIRLYQHALAIQSRDGKYQFRYLSMCGNPGSVDVNPLLNFLRLHLSGGILIACEHYRYHYEPQIKRLTRTTRTGLDFIDRTYLQPFSSRFRRSFNKADRRARKSSKIVKLYLENGGKLGIMNDLFADQIMSEILDIPSERIV